ncbi:type IX secretion system membrane protein PorP/SprF [Cyclobacterium xiamenense]|uniref:PorP/SprF family type IX secretion system membrane protein n=1 Tax=Cyclobacterium xiamenense TaxID=1297121 RepID=UPI0012B8F492|nr:type IX secretion system membrane protein PorP/SprF [Cyclobacterium xiamenense]
MKRTLLLTLSLLISTLGWSQSQKYISQFSHFQSYFNAGLTGYEGSTVRSFVRNQWSGIEGSPKTYFLSFELDFGELGGSSDGDLLGKNAMSVNLLQDTYGAFRETELLLGYASRIRLSSSHNLRLGVGLSYQQIRLDGALLNPEQRDDPTLGQYMGSFTNMAVRDFNMGLALTHRKYYLSYGVHRVNGGRLTSGDAFMDSYPAAQVVQAGFRDQAGPNISVIVNGMYRLQRDLPRQLDLNMKVLLQDRVWVGLGHRVNDASHLQFGVIANGLRLGYIYEFPLSQGYRLPGRIHEFTAVLQLFGQRNEGREMPTIW